MKMLITGGAGFIGSNFCFYMAEKYPDYDLVCVDSLTYAGNYYTIKTLVDGGRLKFVKADISDRKSMDALFAVEKFDTVVNFAAESHVDRSIMEPEVFLKTNIIGTQCLMDCCRKYSVERFHQVSTDEVYGDLPLNRPDLTFSENSPIKTSSPYSASKASADLLVQAYMRTFSFPATISRCSNNYGPYQFPEKLIPLMFIKAKNNEKLPVYGKGENVRDWLYVEDHCSAIDLILHKGVCSEVYNVGGNNEKTNIEIVRIILAALNKPQELISFIQDRPGHDLRYAINADKIKKQLGWKPQTPFEQGIEKTLRWYRENEKWYEDILSGKSKAAF